MKRWEYKGVSAARGDNDGTKIIKKLNKLGKEGWRAVEFCGSGNVIMEREIPEPQAPAKQ